MTIIYLVWSSQSHHKVSHKSRCDSTAKFHIKSLSQIYLESTQVILRSKSMKGEIQFISLLRSVWRPSQNDPQRMITYPSLNPMEISRKFLSPKFQFQTIKWKIPFFSFSPRPLSLPFSLWLSLGISFLGQFMDFGHITIKMNIGYSWTTFVEPRSLNILVFPSRIMIVTACSRQKLYRE